MVHEERFHASFGERRARDLTGDADYQTCSGAGNSDIQCAVDKWYPHALDTFGKAESKFSDLAVAYGIRRWGNEDLRQMYKKDIDVKITEMGLEIPPEDRGRKVF